jgi:hypothetical protein
MFDASISALELVRMLRTTAASRELDMTEASAEERLRIEGEIRALRRYALGVEDTLAAASGADPRPRPRPAGPHAACTSAACPCRLDGARIAHEAIAGAMRFAAEKADEKALGVQEGPERFAFEVEAKTLREMAAATVPPRGEPEPPKPEPHARRVTGVDLRFTMCRCHKCGLVARCTPSFDFYGKDGELLECEACMRAALAEKGVVFLAPNGAKA